MQHFGVSSRNNILHISTQQFLELAGLILCIWQLRPSWLNQPPTIHIEHKRVYYTYFRINTRSYATVQTRLTEMVRNAGISLDTNRLYDRYDELNRQNNRIQRNNLELTFNLTNAARMLRMGIFG